MNKAARDKETWHFRGREARGQGKRRALVDARIAHENRQGWMEGWDAEDLMRAPKPTQAQADEFNAFFKGLAAEVRKGINP